MVMRLPGADPETLGIIFLVGGTFAVLTFGLYSIAGPLGEELETPRPLSLPLEGLRRVALRVLTSTMESPFNRAEAA